MSILDQDPVCSIDILLDDVPGLVWVGGDPHLPGLPLVHVHVAVLQAGQPSFIPLQVEIFFILPTSRIRLLREPTKSK